MTDIPHPGAPQPDIDPTTPDEAPQNDPGYPEPRQPEMDPGGAPQEMPPFDPSGPSA